MSRKFVASIESSKLSDPVIAVSYPVLKEIYSKLRLKTDSGVSPSDLEKILTEFSNYFNYNLHQARTKIDQVGGPM